GVTLVELVITIVIIGIAAAAVLGVYTTTIRASADPMIRAQALSVAELYMDEIMGRPFSGSTGDGNCGSREDWDHVAAYDGLDCQPEDVFGNPLSGLDMLTVSISVADDNSLGIGGGNERRIDVQVSDNAGTVNITLTAWRTREN
ncbi:prepilin-type N-terminal cleavage/methylation domain-containing protein, partial [Gammaproteobacteria bacterium AB-CW1]|nr:prepilin-type N-terminal cleavage/methylation domain-containing protein [Gammaproteobacteria bacterium AB-CW1]